ncbi:MAG: S8 family serine peptidase [Xanthomonadales bacterium]|nr:S8 family serine peptidase [Xanthomonadales bacterium]
MTRLTAFLLPATLALLTGVLTTTAGDSHAHQAPSLTAALPSSNGPTPGGTWLRIHTDADTLLQRGLAAHADYGSFQWLPAESVDLTTLRASGLAITEVADAFVLDLGGERFDPLASGLAGVEAGDDQPDWHLVQFTGPVRQAWLDELQAAQVQPVQYIHPYSYVVWSAPQAVAEVAVRSGDVRWAGHFRPEYRVNPIQRGHGRAVIATMALISRHADEGEVRAALAAAGAQVHEITPVNRDFAVVDMAVAGDQYLQLAGIPAVYTVQYIPPEAGPRGEMSNQSVVGNYGASPSHTVFPGYEDWLIDTGYDGTGVVVGIVDGGVRTTHQDLTGQFLPCVPGGGASTSCGSLNDSHGTHVAGAVAGTGASGTRLNGFLRGQGVAPGAKMIEQRYSPLMSGSGPGGMRPDGMLTIFRESALSGAELANNSWGPGSSPRGYDIPTQQMDIISRDALADEPGAQPVLAVWSIMNGNGDSGGSCAPSSLGSPDEAKNLFAVGSTSMQSGNGSQASQILNISSNSAHGNACDGRRVPHIVAPGCSTDSTSSGSNSAYAFNCGTSMASPVVSGAVAVYMEKFRVENDDHTPSPALVKAAFTAVAKDLQGYRDANNRVMGHRPDRLQGYGRLQLDRVVNPEQPVFSLDQSVIFTTTGENWTQAFEAADPAQPMQIMLAWSDAKGHGLGGTTPAWVNNLDLVVETDGDTYLGNVIGADGWSATGGSADDRNNLEGVFLAPGQHGGEITITVQASNIAADALDPYQPGDLAQDFALVCYNCAPAGTTPPPEPEHDLALTMIDVPDPAQIGGELVFVVQAANFGPDSASQVRVDMQLPEAVHFDLIRVRDSDGNIDPAGSDWSCSSEPDQLVSCLLDPTLPALAMAQVLEVVTRVDSGALPGNIQTTGQISAAGIDPVPDNDTVTLISEIDGPTDIIFRAGFEHLVYLHDDGDGNTNQGPPSSFDPDMLWGNYYLTEDGGEVITQISVAFGPTFPSLADGPVTFWLLDDPDMDLDPRNATALVSVQGTPDVFNDEFFTVSIPPTQVSGAFFVGASAKLLGGEDKPARVDTGGPGETSWFFYAPEIADVIDDLASAPFGARMDDTQYVIFPGAFMVRAAGVPGN